MENLTHISSFQLNQMLEEARAKVKTLQSTCLSLAHLIAKAEACGNIEGLGLSLRTVDALVFELEQKKSALGDFELDAAAHFEHSDGSDYTGHLIDYWCEIVQPYEKTASRVLELLADADGDTFAV